MSIASKPLNFFRIVIYDLWPTYSFLFPLLTAPLEMVTLTTSRINLIDITNIDKICDWQNMWLSWPKILISVQADWLWSTGRGGVNYKLAGNVGAVCHEKQI